MIPARVHGRSIRTADGFSLLEALISSLLFTMILGGLGSVLWQSQTTFEVLEGDMGLRQEGRVGMNVLTTWLRLAGYGIDNLPEAITLATPDSIQFVADVDDGSSEAPCGALTETSPNGGAERMTYRLEGASVLVTVECWDGTVWTPDFTDLVVTTNAGPGGLLLRFFDGQGSELDATGGLSATQRRQVRAVEIALSLEDLSRELATGTEPHTLFTTSELIKLRNLRN